MERIVQPQFSDSRFDWKHFAQEIYIISIVIVTYKEFDHFLNEFLRFHQEFRKLDFIRNLGNRGIYLTQLSLINILAMKIYILKTRNTRQKIFLAALLCCLAMEIYSSRLITLIKVEHQYFKNFCPKSFQLISNYYEKLENMIMQTNKKYLDCIQQSICLIRTHRKSKDEKKN